MEGLRVIEEDGCRDGDKLLEKLTQAIGNQKPDKENNGTEKDFHNMDEIFDCEAEEIEAAIESSAADIPKPQGTRPSTAKKPLIQC